MTENIGMTWEECREQFREWRTQYEADAEQDDDEHYQQACNYFIQKAYYMLPLIDALEKSDIKVGTKLASHHALYLGLHANYFPGGFSVQISWDQFIEKYYVRLLVSGERDKAELPFTEMLPTIQRYLLHLQDIENELDNNPE